MNVVQLDPGSSQVASPSRVGAHFGKSREWARSLLKEWYAEQQRGGPPKVFRKGRVFYTTMSVLREHMPRGRDEALHRKLRELEHGLEQAYARIAELERRIGRRR